MWFLGGGCAWVDSGVVAGQGMRPWHKLCQEVAGRRLEVGLQQVAGVETIFVLAVGIGFGARSQAASL